MPGTLYIVATPIGNLEDLTPRAARILNQVGLIAAEDTRQTRKLLTYLGISNRLVSYNQHNARSRTSLIVKALNQQDVALVSDAGVPGISDPGRELVLAAVKNEIHVVPIPGVSAVTTAISVSGMSGDSFKFLGFLPRTKTARKKLLSELKSEALTSIMFESPHRLRATLNDISAVLTRRTLVICRELTKLHEEIYRGTAEDALEHFSSPRGEFVIVMHGGSQEDSEPVDMKELLAAVAELKKLGKTRRDSVPDLMDKFGISRREAYQSWLRL